MKSVLALYVGGFPVFAGTVLNLGFAMLLLGEYFARVGCGFLRFLGYAPRGSLERLGAGFLAGLSLTGAAFFGLACTGLYSPAGLVLAMAALAAGTRGFLRGWPLLWGAAQEARGLGRLAICAISLAVAPVIYSQLVPCLEQDVYIYHLGAPAQYLISHRILLDMVPLTFQLPMPIELTFAIPILFGDDRLASFMVFSSFMAACILFLGWHAAHRAERMDGPDSAAGDASGKVSAPAARPGGKDAKRRGSAGPEVDGGGAGTGAIRGIAGLAAGWVRKQAEGDLAWVGVLLALSSWVILYFVGITKIDVAAAAIFMAGVIMWESGNWAAASAMFGFSIAAKMVYAPFVAIWLIVRFPSVKTFILSGILAALPVLPWWFKSFVSMGNPFFPVGGELFRMWNWGIENMKSFDVYSRPFSMKDTFTLSGTVGAWFRSMHREELPILLVLPCLLVIRDTRLPALAMVAAHLVLLRTGHITRYCIPAILYFSLVAARAIPRLLPMGRYVLLLLALVSLIRIWALPGYYPVRQGYPFRSLEDGRKRMSALYWNACQAARGLHPRRTLLIGEIRTYLVPGRVVYNGLEGETQLVWKIARESANANDFARKIRQLGVDVLLFNHVTAEWAQRYSGAFMWWDLRMFDLYVRYCRGHLEHVWHSDGSDYVDGGFYLWRIRGRPFPDLPKNLLFAPGSEPIYQASHELGGRNQWASAAEAMKPLALKYPNVMSLRSEIAYFYSRMADWPEVYRWVKPAYEAGLRDSGSFTTYGLAAFAYQKLDVAYPILKESLVKYPFAGNVVALTLAITCYGLAVNVSKAGKLDDAWRLVDEGEAALRTITRMDEQDQKDFNIRAALLKGFRADMLAWRGKCVEAGALYREALALGQGVPGTETWKKRADDPCPRTGNRSPVGLFNGR